MANYSSRDGRRRRARVTECQTSKGQDGYWAWPEIDGRRCWYLGRAGKDKRLLTRSKPAPRVEPPTPMERRPIRRSLGSH
jgi:hypothetical protein